MKKTVSVFNMKTFAVFLVSLTFGGQSCKMLCGQISKKTKGKSDVHKH